MIALGGNALSRPGEEGNIEQQYRHTTATCRHLADLIQQGCQVVLTHGNGPQVGNVLRRVEIAAGEVYRLPLDICGADTQGGMGYMIATCLQNVLLERGIERCVSTIITRVEVDPADPDFQNPSKPIGMHYDAQRAEEFRRDLGWRMVEVPKHGFRRVVPSPLPKTAIEIDLIRRLASDGELLVVGGGGGIPVKRNGNGTYEGVEAVIDKDRTSALLAHEIDAATFLIVTSVERVALNYGKPEEQPLEEMSVSEARGYLAKGQFPPGSMGPKIEAAVDFLENSTRDDVCVMICDVEHMADALAGKSGTRMVRDR